LRPLLVTKAFAEEKFDAAIGAACAYIEKELRVLLIGHGAVVSPTDTGADLCKIAYHREDGVISPPYPVAAQAHHGVFLMAQGFMLYLRNGFLHNKVEGMDPDVAYDLMCMCDAFNSLIQNSTGRCVRKGDEQVPP
jgi:hypothetical protein